MGFQFLGIPPKGELVFHESVLLSWELEFPISRDPPEGGTFTVGGPIIGHRPRFQFLGIPPKGELDLQCRWLRTMPLFPISRNPPEGGTLRQSLL